VRTEIRSSAAGLVPHGGATGRVRPIKRESKISASALIRTFDDERSDGDQNPVKK
jgi:hypothetical protein